MPPKAAKASSSSAKAKTSAPPVHASYKDMIKEAILNLKERNGSSRQAIKKYVRANNTITTTSESQFDSLFNKALKTGVEKGDFSQPKGKSEAPAAADEPKPVKKTVSGRVSKSKTTTGAPKKTAKATTKKVAAAKPAKKSTPKKSA
ncbi:hypothetical protein DV736_g2682, partial [Chaetothyriales sp. CBS 134916]